MKAITIELTDTEYEAMQHWSEFLRGHYILMSSIEELVLNAVREKYNLPPTYRIETTTGTTWTGKEFA